MIKKALTVLAAFSGLVMYVCFVGFLITGRDVPKSNIEYPLAMDAFGFAMVAAASACAALSIINWMAGEVEQ